MDDDLTRSAPLELFGVGSVTRRGAELLKAITPGARLRASLAIVEATGAQGYEPAMTRFITGFAIGEGDALRRAALALSDPRAKGRERDVVLAMADGLDIEDALLEANKPPPDPYPVDDNKVIPFRR